MKDASLQVHTVAAPVRQQVIETLFSAITTGRFKPGQRLIEKELCELMGVSRPSVREALRHLESEGLVETIPHRGPIVASLTVSEIKGIYQIRGALEALAAKLLAESGTEQQLRELQDAYDELAITMSSNDVDAAMAAKDRFYAALMHGSGNSMIASILKSMNARITMLRRVSMSSPGRAPNTLRELKRVVEAVKNRQPDVAHSASFEHIERAAEVAIKSLTPTGD